MIFRKTEIQRGHAERGKLVGRDAERGDRKIRRRIFDREVIGTLDGFEVRAKLHNGARDLLAILHPRSDDKAGTLTRHATRDVAEVTSDDCPVCEDPAQGEVVVAPDVESSRRLAAGREVMKEECLRRS